MLDKHVFLQGITLLQRNYINWTMNSFDKQTLGNVLEVWYGRFEKLDKNVFFAMVEHYLENSTFPPNSPADLLDSLKDILRKNKMTSQDAWTKTLELVREYGFRYNADKIYESVKEDEALVKTIEEFERELENLKSDDQYVAERFKKSYENNLKRKVEKESITLLGKKDVSKLLEFDKILQIENSKGEK